MPGTLSWEDFYGGASRDTLSDAPTTDKTNPNDPEQSGITKPGQRSILNLKGNVLGQPLIVWAALLGLLVGVKYLTEKVWKA